MTRIICGYLRCERHAEDLFLSGLPAILKINVRSSPAGAWIESAIRHCVSDLELQQAGRLAVLGHGRSAVQMSATAISGKG